MAREQAISIPLIGPNQKAPTSSGPVGRLQQIKNGVVNKTQEGQIRVQKRDGFAKLTNNVRTPQDGTFVNSSGVPAPALLSGADASERLVAADEAGSFYRFNQELPAWELAKQLAPDGSQTANASVYLPVSQLSETLLSNNTFVAFPDVSTVGNLRCYVWGEGDIVNSLPAPAIWFMVVDQFGVRVRGPNQIIAPGGGVSCRVKTISDGTNFWVFYDNGSTGLGVFVLNGTTGETLATNTTFDTLATAGNHWDIVFDSSVGVCFAAALSPAFGFKFTRLTYAASTISVAVQHSNFDVGPSESVGGTMDAGLGFLVSREGDGHVYLGTVVSGDGRSILVDQLNSNGTSAHIYTVISDGTTVVGIGALTGFVIPGTANVWVAITQYPQTAQPLRNAIVETASCTLGGTASTPLLQRASAAASRPMFVNGRFLIAIWYPSQLSQIFDPQASSITLGTQPTYFMYDIMANQIQGAFAFDIAAMDYALFGWTAGLSTAPGAGFFMLPSIAQDSNGLHLPLVEIFQRSDFQGQPTASTLIADVVFTGLPCRAVEYADELLLPGMTGTDEGDLSEQGFWLAPEPPTMTQGNIAGTALTPLQTYQYIFIWARLDARGDIVQSQLSITQEITLTGSNNQVTLMLPTLRQTRASRVLIGMYRSYVNALGVMSTDHRLVFPLPLAASNNPTEDTITLIDNKTDATVAMGQPLYADPSIGLTGAPQPLEYWSPPPWTVGDTFADREFIVADDGSVRFSMQKVQGQQVAFHPDLSITLPSAERIRSIAAMDGFLLFGCDASVWFIENSGFPDATGTGNIPTPQQLPFPNGMKSVAKATKDGVFYVSSAGGIWMVGRDLTNVYVGASIEDDAAHATIVDIEVDQAQRVHFIDIAGQQDLVWDPTVQQWYTWSLPALPLLGANYQGALVFGAPSNIWYQAAGTFVDDTAAIITSIPLAPMSFAGVPGLQMVWEIQFLGQRLGRCTQVIDMFYNDDTQTFERFQQDSDSLGMNFALGQAYRFAVEPSNPECQAIAATISDAFPLGPSAGFTLENVGASVGIVPGAGRINIAQRIAG
jgi:hypothetical protein